MPNTAKQEAIRKAYGELYEVMKENINHTTGSYLIESTHFYDKNDFYKRELFDVREYSDSLLVITPKSLQGLENNNGWIRIESEDWLKEHRINSSTTKFYIDDPDEDYFDIAIQLNDKEESIVGLSDYLFMKDILIKSNIKATHYQPIVKPEKPIY